MPCEAGVEEAGGAQTLVLSVSDLPDSYGTVGKHKQTGTRKGVTRACFLVQAWKGVPEYTREEVRVEAWSTTDVSSLLHSSLSPCSGPKATSPLCHWANRSSQVGPWGRNQGSLALGTPDRRTGTRFPFIWLWGVSD